MTGTPLLLVDDDEAYRTVMGEQIARLGYDVHLAATGAEGLRAVDSCKPEVVLLDLRLPDVDGLEVLRRLRTGAWSGEVVMLTGQGSIETAVEAVRIGAADYVSKPCPLAELDMRIRKALEGGRLLRRERQLEKALSARDPGPAFVGESPAFRRLHALIERAAPSASSVLIHGETGTGKGMAARLLHARSARRDRPFVVVECAGLQDDLLRDELFGHEAGAYTGAGSSKTGLFQIADGGTVFLDEIGEMSLVTQAKLLRVLDEGTFRRLGGTAEIRVDVRVLTATHRDLDAMVREGKFRADLLYRLQTIAIRVPPLRERSGDVALLAEHFLNRLNARLGGAKTLAPQALPLLERYAWPGNVRQLLHELESAYILSEGTVILPEYVSVLRADRRHTVEAIGNGERLPTLAEAERVLLEQALRATDGHRQRAAKALGISQRTLYRMLLRYGLEG